MDLCSASPEKIIIPKSEYTIVPTNLIMEIPDGFEAQVRPRSGLALKYGVTVLNTPGTTDSSSEIKSVSLLDSLYNISF